MKTLIILTIAPMFIANSTFGQSITDNCEVIESSCDIKRDCSLERRVDGRNCATTISVPCPTWANPVRFCQKSLNDPSCESSKAAQNAIYEAQYAANKLDCERLKTIERTTCLNAANNLALACKENKAANKLPTDISYFEEQVLLARNGQNSLLPTSVIDYVRNSLIMSEYAALVETIIVAPVPSGAKKLPSYAEKFVEGYPIGNVIFLREYPDINSPSITFWLTQIELVRLFSLYGTNDFGNALSKNTDGFLDLVKNRVEKICQSRSCV